MCRVTTYGKRYSVQCPKKKSPLYLCEAQSSLRCQRTWAGPRNMMISSTFSYQNSSLVPSQLTDCPRLLLPAQPHGDGLIRVPRPRRPILCHCQPGGQATELPVQLLQPAAQQWQQQRGRVGWWWQVGRQKVGQEINSCLTASISSRRRSGNLGCGSSAASQGWFLGMASIRFFSSPSGSAT